MPHIIIANKITVPETTIGLNMTIANNIDNGQDQSQNHIVIPVFTPLEIILVEIKLDFLTFFFNLSLLF